MLTKSESNTEPSLRRAGTEKTQLKVLRNGSPQMLEEFHRVFFEEARDGLWLAKLDQPLPRDTPPVKQMQHLLQFACLSYCNKVFAKMFGCSRPEELSGFRLAELFLWFDEGTLRAFRNFFLEGYKMSNEETRQLAKSGQSRYYVSSCFGVIEGEYLVRIWGWQRDITERKMQKMQGEIFLERLTLQQQKVLEGTVQGLRL